MGGSGEASARRLALQLRVARHTRSRRNPALLPERPMVNWAVGMARDAHTVMAFKIEDYGLIGNTRTAALVSRFGDID
jgi:hypothetical protein